MSQFENILASIPNFYATWIQEKIQKQKDEALKRKDEAERQKNVKMENALLLFEKEAKSAIEQNIYTFHDNIHDDDNDYNPRRLGKNAIYFHFPTKYWNCFDHEIKRKLQLKGYVVSNLYSRICDDMTTIKFSDPDEGKINWVMYQTYQ